MESVTTIRVEKVLQAMLLSIAVTAGTSAYCETNQIPEKIKNSVVEIGSHCSGVLVSDQGHVLTALHCLYDLNDTRLATDHRIHELPSQDGFDRYLAMGVAKNEIAGQRFCGELSLNIVNGVAACFDVVAVGSGWPWFHSEWISENLPQKLRYEIRSRNFDYAILKYESLPSNIRCSPISPSAPSHAQSIWIAGYPDGFSENGKRELYVGSGQSFDSFASIRKLRGFELSTDNLVDSLSDPSRYFATTALSHTGMSGGGVFEQSGGLLGINSMKPVYFPKTSTKLKPLTSHVSISAISADLRTKLSPTEIANIFRCK